MKSPIFRAVSMPPTLFWVPFKVTLLNISLFTLCFVIGTVISNVNPIFFLIGLFIGHFILIGVATKEPHLDKLCEVWLTTPKKTINLLPPLYGTKKYIP